MKVILLQDVKKQGKKDQVINVSDGYANNYLFPNNLAVPCNQDNKNKLDRDLKKREEIENATVAECNVIKKRMEKEKIKFKVKSGENGKMFGTISSKQIASELKNLGYDIDKKKIEIDHTIDTLGVHTVKVILHKEVVALVNIHIS